MANDERHIAASAPSANLSPDFEALFRTLPSPYMVLDRQLNYVDANEAYCATVERPREDLLGRHIFDLFPNAGPSGDRLRESLEQVVATGQPHSLPLIPYPIPLPISRGGGVEMRYWSAAHTPLLDAEGRTRFIVQNTVDVTELQQLKQIAYGPGGETPTTGEKDLLQRARDVEAVNLALSQETQGLRDLFMQAPSFMAVLAGPDFTLTLVNTAYQQLIGHRQVIGRTLAEALPEVREQGFIDLLTSVMASGKPYIGTAVAVRLVRTPGGAPEERFIDFIYQPIQSRGGKVWGVFVEGSDVTDRVLAERQQKLLVDELNHRVKNSLATVQAIADQTLRSTPEPTAFREKFESRLMALSATHDLLTETSWRSADLVDVLGVEFRPYEPSQYALDGPSVALTPAEALALGLVFHELATNAAKYGALSTPGGRVGVRWRVEDAALHLTWSERDGPRVAPPTRRGFGSRLIERSLQGQLNGAATLNFQPDGLTCGICLPLKAGG